MKHIANFSGGACSFWSAHRMIERYGKENCILLFADTLVEDPDLYAFNRRAEEVLGVHITRICEGRTPWQLFRDENMIGNNKYPICSIRLKRDLLDAWMTGHFEMNRNQDNALYENAAVYLGFDWTEIKRVDDMRASHPNWQVEAPMAEWKPVWDKCKIIAEASKALDIEPPLLYRLGFPHNNCGGRCVRAGISHWVHLLKLLPERYAEWEKEEQDTMALLESRGVKWLTMLKDRRGGVVNNLSLLMLRQRVEAGEKFPDDDWGGCGCGGTA